MNVAPGWTELPSPARPTTSLGVSLLDLGQLGFGASGTLERLLKCTVFMTDIEQYGPMNEVYAEYFADVPPPARTAVAVSALPFGALVEVECVARR